jgi:hypothetical protein
MSESIDQRKAQAIRLWNWGFGRELSFGSYDAYLATIPQVSESLLGDDPDLPLLSLADPRLGLFKICKLIGIRSRRLGTIDEDVAPFNERHADPIEPFWFRHDDGRCNRGRRPDHCREELTGDILAGTALVGAMAYLHHPRIIVKDKHVIDLPGSVSEEARTCCIHLVVHGLLVEFNVIRHVDVAVASFGTLRFRRGVTAPDPKP